MRPIPQKLKNQIALDPYMKQCIYEGCSDPPEWEHAFIYAGKQINETWAIVPACTYHHRGAGLDKSYNEYCALKRATKSELAEYPRVNWEQKLKHLSNKYAS